MKTYEEFKNALRERESSNNYKCVNKFGFLGAYQFGKPRLYDLGYSIDGWRPTPQPAKKIISREQFLSDKQLQDNLFDLHVRKGLKTVLSLIRDNPTGKSISGLFAVFHLLGPGGLRSFLRGTSGKDGLGTSADDYYNLFKGYELL